MLYGIREQNLRLINGDLREMKEYMQAVELIDKYVPVSTTANIWNMHLKTLFCGRTQESSGGANLDANFSPAGRAVGSGTRIDQHDISLTNTTS